MKKTSNTKQKFKEKSGKDAKKFRSTKGRETINDVKNMESCGSTPNDWRWYAANPQLLKDTATIPFTSALGVRNDLGPHARVWNARTIPGVMAISVMPTFGYSDNPNSPINVASRNIYSYIRHANSGSANYDSPDLMLYLCAMDSMYSYHEYLKRIYGVIQTYSYENRYYPKALVTAMGVDFDNLQSNMANFRAFINAYAVKVGSLCVPASMSYMAKHSWMYRGLYLDSKTTKSQTYLFKPAGIYKFELDADGAGSLVSIRLEDTTSANFGLERGYLTRLLKLEDLIYLANQMLDPVLQSEDFGIMSGDILKAFGAENVVKISGIDEDYTILPTYDDTVLDIIQNTTLMGRCKTKYRFDTETHTIKDDSVVNSVGNMTLAQSENKDYLVSTPRFLHPNIFEDSAAPDPGQNAMFADRILNFEHNDVQPAEIMEATRLCNIASDYDEGTRTFGCRTIGSEVALFARVYEYADWNETGEWVLARRPLITLSMPFVPNDITFDINDDSTITDSMKSIGAYLSAFFATMVDISTFNRHPAIAPVVGIEWSEKNGNSTIASQTYEPFNGFLTDYDYYAHVTADNLSVMSEVALLSQFNIRQYGRNQI